MLLLLFFGIRNANRFEIVNRCQESPILRNHGTCGKEGTGGFLPLS
jgi:hypothetical protein